jgi:adenylate cyclase
MAHWSYALTVISTLVLVVAVGVIKVQFLPDLSNLVFDWYQRLDPRAWDPESPVRIVDIDDESLTRIGQWPWPRSTVAELVARLGRLGAAVVVVDIVFAEPDGMSSEHVITLLPPTPGRALLEQEIKERTSNDAVLAQAIAATPTVLGAILTQDGRAVDFRTSFGIATAGDDPIPFLPHFTGAVVPLPILIAASAGLGALNWLPDRDQIVRRVPLVLALGDKIVPSLSVEALRVVQGASTVVVRSSNASGQGAFGARSGVNTVKIGDLEIPTDPQGELRVHYTRSEPRRSI